MSEWRAVNVKDLERLGKALRQPELSLNGWATIVRAFGVEHDLPDRYTRALAFVAKRDFGKVKGE